MWKWKNNRYADIFRGLPLSKGTNFWTEERDQWMSFGLRRIPAHVAFLKSVRGDRAVCRLRSAGSGETSFISQAPKLEGLAWNSIKRKNDDIIVAIKPFLGHLAKCKCLR